jgi:hypothetical protein
MRRHYTTGARAWAELAADARDGWTLEPGERYAVLASVSKNFDRGAILAKVTPHGLTPTYVWEQGDPVRSVEGKPQFNVDVWIEGLPPDPRDNHRWVYGEGTMGAGAKPWRVPQDPPWPFTMFHIAHVMHAVDAPDVGPAPALPPEESATLPPARRMRPAGKVAIAAFGIGGLLLAARRA